MVLLKDKKYDKNVDLLREMNVNKEVTARKKDDKRAVTRIRPRVPISQTQIKSIPSLTFQISLKKLLLILIKDEVIKG